VLPPVRDRRPSGFAFSVSGRISVARRQSRRHLRRGGADVMAERPATGVFAAAARTLAARAETSVRMRDAGPALSFARSLKRHRTAG